MKKAVLLLSGGLDSAANLALAGEGGFEVSLAVTVDYGQRAARRELESAQQLTRYFSIPHFSIPLQGFPSWLEGKGGALFGDSAVPVPESRTLDDLSVTRETAKAVWVPNRNAMFISIAAAIAESRGLEAVAVGFNAEEAATFPDNSAAFMSVMTEALSFSTSNHVEVVSATVHLDKKQIARKLMQKAFPLRLVWSCYLGGEKQCGRCESCGRFERAMREGRAHA